MIFSSRPRDGVYVGLMILSVRGEGHRCVCLGGREKGDQCLVSMKQTEDTT